MIKTKFTPEVDKHLKNLRANIEKQLINILHLEFQSYLSKQGYNELSSWYIGTSSKVIRSTGGDKYRNKNLNSYFLRLKDDTIVEIKMDEENLKFWELYNANKESD